MPQAFLLVQLLTSDLYSTGVAQHEPLSLELKPAAPHLLLRRANSDDAKVGHMVELLPAALTSVLVGAILVRVRVDSQLT